MLVALFSAVACDGSVRFAGTRVEVPERWEGEERVRLPRRHVRLVAPDRRFACEGTTLRDGRSFSEADANALVGDALRVYGAGEAEDVELTLGMLTLRGKRFETRQVPGWELEGNPPWDVDVYAAAVGTELVSLVAIRGLGESSRLPTCQRVFGAPFAAGER